MENEKVTAASLHLEVLVYIFQLLDTDGKGKAAQVCSSWRKAADCKAVWKNAYVLLRSHNLNIQSEENIIKRGIKRFDVHSSEQRVIEFLRRVPDLEHLRFLGCCVKQNTGHFFEALLEADGAFKLLFEGDHRNHLLYKGVENDFWRTFYHYHRANDSTCRVNNDLVLKTFTTGMKQLKVLHLEGCKCLKTCSGGSHYLKTEINYLAEEDTVHEDQLVSLQRLCLNNFSPMSEKTIHYISQRFLNLVSLIIESSEIMSGAAFVHLSKLKKLESLHLLKCAGITDVLFSSISLLSNLKNLDIEHCGQITGSALKSISRLTNLICFRCSNLVVTDEAFEHLNEMPCLQELILPYSTITDAGLYYLAKGSLKLTTLDLPFCYNVTNQGLINICRSKFDLYQLDVSGNEVTNHGVGSVIKKFSHLQALKLYQCVSVTDMLKQFALENFNPYKYLNAYRKHQGEMIFNNNPKDACLEDFITVIVCNHIVPSSIFLMGFFIMGT